MSLADTAQAIGLPNTELKPKRIWATAFVGAGLARADFWSAKSQRAKWTDYEITSLLTVDW